MRFKENNLESTKVINDNFVPFNELGLEEPLLKSLREQKFEKPTLIQEKAIPLAIAGKDIIATSATGSGKTLAFGASIIQSAKRGFGVQALILTPTRELAEQVCSSLKIFAKYYNLRIVSVYGGASISKQIFELTKADVVVATPGRLLDHITRRTIKLNKLKTLVLDEADTMFDMGFITDVEKIIKVCPSERQTLLFSATMTTEITNLIKKHTKNAVNLFSNTSVATKKLTQVSYDVAKDQKFSLLAHLLKNEKSELAMVFCNTRRCTELVAKNLKHADIEANVIHGGLSQNERNKVIKLFHAKRVQVLVCTDVAARGLDIKGVSHVYNYDLPIDSHQYTHRVGRTARAGKEGKAINILSKADFHKFPRVVGDNYKSVAKQKMPSIEKAKFISFA